MVCFNSSLHTGGVKSWAIAHVKEVTDSIWKQGVVSHWLFRKIKAFYIKKKVSSLLYDLRGLLYNACFNGLDFTEADCCRLRSESRGCDPAK